MASDDELGMRQRTPASTLLKVISTDVSVGTACGKATYDGVVVRTTSLDNTKFGFERSNTWEESMGDLHHSTIEDTARQTMWLAGYRLIELTSTWTVTSSGSSRFKG